MDRIHHLFLWLTIIGPLHMVEQMLTSLEEFHMIQGAMAGYYGWFAPDRADLASVVMISLVWTLVSVIIYALLRGGAAMRAVMYVFGVFAVSELHHLQEAFGKGGYDAGVLTCVPYAWVGGLLLKAVWDAARHERQPLAGRSPLYTLGR
jgi:hypothetical protein